MKKVAFICVHNSCRSQMAEGFAKVYGKGVFEAYSAGTEKYHEVKPLAVVAMADVGIDICDQHPKLLDAIPSDLDIVITMGCGVACPALKAQTHEDWGLSDPSGGPLEAYRVTRDLIKLKVIDLVNRIQKGEI